MNKKGARQVSSNIPFTKIKTQLSFHIGNLSKVIILVILKLRDSEAIAFFSVRPSFLSLSLFYPVLSFRGVNSGLFDFNHALAFSFPKVTNYKTKSAITAFFSFFFRSIPSTEKLNISLYTIP